ncbi:hypothetical protein [Sulfitobacter sp.]|uniref:hypothetical protein n=1 Tax=Sulfitobacter sp. TaxID=1903071 RepID=UPI0030034A43
MKSLDIALSVAPHVRALQDRGMDVDATQDFDEVRRRWAQTGRKEQSPMMDVNRHEFTQRDAFWLFLTEGDETVGGIGVKYVDLVDESFDSYLRRTSRAQYDRLVDPINSIARPVLDQVSGRLVYIGELEFREDKRGRISILTALVGLAKALAAQEWSDFQWMYAFIPKEHVRFIYAYGFSYQLANAVTWHEPVPAGRLNSHFIILLDRYSFAHSVMTARKATDLLG